MSSYRVLATAIVGWANKYNLSSKYAFQLIYATFLSTPEKLAILQDQETVTNSMLKDLYDNFLNGYDMKMIATDLEENAEEIQDQSGEDWRILTINL